MNVLMIPHISHFRNEESGIKRVCEAYAEHLPKFGVRLVAPGEPYDIKAVHAGTTSDATVAHAHGLYWTGDYAANAWEWQANAHVINSVRHAKEVTVPSAWVAETFAREMRFQPHVVGHGINWDEWAHHGEPTGDFVLWNKNRMGDVCDPKPVVDLARRFPKGHFVSTFAPRGAPGNINAIGVIPHDQMKRLVQSCLVYLATTKETFGIGILEAMAAGVPVLAYAHGGVLEMVQHGVNGYLAEPDDVQDLIQGLQYCIHHRDVLGMNGRELAREWTWERACEKVARVYELAVQEQEPTVAVVIPSYNYADKVGRAVQSALAQTRYVTKVVVVDDGSDDDGATERAIKAIMDTDSRVVYHRQNNAGVANARNRGIDLCPDVKYVVPLDADDAIAPTFVEKCVSALELDPGLGIAYTGLYYTTPDGREGLSQWPGPCNFDDQIRAKNQVPTCVVMRREMWKRLGGYRQRYAPRGAGEEDAEFWLRCGAYGWGARKVTDEGLFLYSWQSGRVSGATDHAVTDWRGWHPWVKDGLHPFASAATPAKHSHPVRQYDEPVISVVIPVGPGHEKDVINALDSLEAQTLRKWEAVVVFDCDTGVEIEDGVSVGDPAMIRPEIQYLLDAHPYCRWWATAERRGPGYARNRGVELARAPFVLFLDADDHLYPKALERMLETWEEQGEAIIYSDYVGKAIIGDVSALDQRLQQKVYQLDKQTGEAVIGYTPPNYNCEAAQRQPDREHPFIWCNITCLVPKKWHKEIGGFDEALRSWEDVDYWWRMARAGKCFVRIPEELLVYRFYTGARRDEGFQRHKELIEYLIEKYKEIPTMPCSGCGKRAPAVQRPQVSAPPAVVARTAPQHTSTVDSDWILCVYSHPNRGHHPVLGGAEFPAPIPDIRMEGRGGKWKIHYGMRAGGEQFLVHKLDVQSASHLFVPVPQAVEVPKEERETPEEPEPLEGAEPPAPVRLPETPAPKPLVSSSGPPIAPAQEQPAPVQTTDELPTPAGPVKGPRPELVVGEAAEMPDEIVAEAEQTAPPVQQITPSSTPNLDPPVNLQKFPGINAKAAEAMAKDGINSLQDLVSLGAEGLQNYPGIGPARARMVWGAIERLIAGAAS